MFESPKEAKPYGKADGLAHDSGHVIDDIKQAAHNIKRDAQEAVTRSDWKNVAVKTGREARLLADTAGHSVMNASTALTTKIRDNPLQASLVALGFGFVIGKLLRR